MIKSYYAWVAEGKSGEYTVGAFIEGMGHVPLFSHKRKMIESMRALAVRHAFTNGEKVRLVKFTRARVIDVIE